MVAGYNIFYADPAPHKRSGITVRSRGHIQDVSDGEMRRIAGVLHYATRDTYPIIEVWQKNRLIVQISGNAEPEIAALSEKEKKALLHVFIDLDSHSSLRIGPGTKQKIESLRALFAGPPRPPDDRIKKPETPKDPSG